MLNYPLRSDPRSTPSPIHPSPAQAGAQMRAADDGAQPAMTSASATGPRPAPGKEEGGSETEDWDTAFLHGLADVLTHFATPLLGGDTVSLPAHAPRVLTLTALGDGLHAPTRSGAQAGDALWVTGTIGDAGAGLAIARGATGPDALLAAYRRPQPRLAEGRALARSVHAMMDVSDGVLIDAARMAEASGRAVTIDLAALRSPPLTAPSPAKTAPPA